MFAEDLHGLQIVVCLLIQHPLTWPLQNFLRAFCAAQLIRAAISKHTGLEPPKPPPPPQIKAYGEVGLYENVTLRSQIRHLYPGDGVTSRRPLIMEEYGQSCVFPDSLKIVLRFVLLSPTSVDFSYISHGYIPLFI